MRNKKAGFALPLPKVARLLGAFIITQQKANVSGLNSLLLALMEQDGELNPDQKKTLAMVNFSGDRKKEIVNVFWRIYNDEEAIAAYLNKEISANYFKRKKHKGETVIDASVRNILESSIGIDLLI